MLRNTDQVMDEIMGLHKKIQATLQNDPPCRATYQYIADLLGDARRLTTIHENLVRYCVTECQIREEQWHHAYQKRLQQMEPIEAPVGHLRKQVLKGIQQ